MKKKGRTAFPYALLRTEVVLFLVLLALAVAAIAQYPRLCLSLGQRALQAGEEEKAVRLLERADSEEATALLRSIRTAQAERLIDEGDYEEAQALLAELSVTDPDDARVAACLYGRAMASMDRGAYEEAMDLLSSIPGHRDAGEQRRRCEKALAQQAFQAGEWDTALLYVRMNPQDQEMQAIATAIRRQDALDRLSSEDPEAGLALLRQLWQEGEDVEADLLTALRRCYPDLYQDKDDAVLLQELRQMDEAALEEKDQRLEKQLSLPKGVLALGNEHTVLLKQDGTVLACGDDRFGQCDVGSWTDVVAVAAGAYHTLGLRADGTVLSAGDNSRGQCDVGGIRGAVEIVAHGFDTAVRCEDGTVLCRGAHDYAALAADWQQISALSLGGYALLGLTETGTALSTEPAFLTEAFRNLLALDAAGTFAAGVTEEGRVVTSALWQPDWEGMVAVSAAQNGVMALKEDGTVHFLLREPGDYGPILARDDVVAIAFSGRHAAALLQDGTLLVCGADSAGQCALSGASR